MRVFVTGATGFVGTAVVGSLLRAGHEVVGLVRSADKALALAARGVRVFEGSLEDLDGLRRAASSADGVIHTAFVHDFANLAASGPIDVRAIEAMGEALREKPFVVTSAVTVLRPGRLGSEDDLPEPGPGGGHRLPSEDVVRRLAKLGVRASIVRLPPTVHDQGDYGFVPALIGIARQKGVSAYLGAGENRWSAVHRADAAEVYRLALERGAAGVAYHAVAEEGIATRRIAELIGQKLGLPVVSKSSNEADAHFGWLSRFFAADLPRSSELTRARLGWSPTGPSLLEDLQGDHYFAR